MNIKKYTYFMAIIKELIIIIYFNWNLCCVFLNFFKYWLNLIKKL